MWVIRGKNLTFIIVGNQWEKNDLSMWVISENIVLCVKTHEIFWTLSHQKEKFETQIFFVLTGEVSQRERN